MKTVNELQGEISKLQNEIYQIQAECKHPLYEIGMWSWRPGATHPSRICSSCRTPVAGITEEEVALVNASVTYARK